VYDSTFNYRRMDCMVLFYAIIDANHNHQISSGVSPLVNVTRDEIDEACRNSGSISQGELARCVRKNPITQWIVFATNTLSAGAGVIIVLMVVIGGIQYSTAGANPQAVNAAKGKIVNALIALLALTFLYAFLQWLIPGGVF